MHTVFGKAQMVFGLLALGGTLSSVPPRHPSPHTPTPRRWHQDSSLVIRVSQESSPGAGDFDAHVLGSLRALHTPDSAVKFFNPDQQFGCYTNTVPALADGTSHVFFVNVAEGIALFEVHNKPGKFTGGGSGPRMQSTRWELSGGKARFLWANPDHDLNGKEDLDLKHYGSNDSVFTFRDDGSNYNGIACGMVIGPLPARFTLLSQFTVPPSEARKGGWAEINGSWVAISADGSRISLRLVKGQRVRFDVVSAAPVHKKP